MTPWIEGTLAGKPNGPIRIFIERITAIHSEGEGGCLVYTTSGSISLKESLDEVWAQISERLK